MDWSDTKTTFAKWWLSDSFHLARMTARHGIKDNSTLKFHGFCRGKVYKTQDIHGFVKGHLE